MPPAITIGRFDSLNMNIQDSTWTGLPAFGSGYRFFVSGPAVCPPVATV
jgi:hypothetical protein